MIPIICPTDTVVFVQKFTSGVGGSEEHLLDCLMDVCQSVQRRIERVFDSVFSVWTFVLMGFVLQTDDHLECVCMQLTRVAMYVLSIHNLHS